MTIDLEKVEEFAGQVLGDQGAAISALLVHLGDKLGLYKTMDGAGPISSLQLAAQSNTSERYVREWLSNQAASGYVTYDAATETFELPPEHAMVLAQEGGPSFMVGGFESITGLFRMEPQMLHAFLTGAGVGWHEYDPYLFQGCERFFKPAYLKHLVESWIPAMPDVEERLRAGARVADVGCGHGASTLVMAQAYPNSSFVGFDSHSRSIGAAQEHARQQGLEERVTFKNNSAQDFPGFDYDLVCFFDCLHDMGDPVKAVSHTWNALAPGGSMMLVEPLAGDRLEDNLNPVGRLYYGFSTVCCVPVSTSQDMGLALGAQAGQVRLADVAMEGGFSGLKRVAETAVNIVLQAKR